MNGLSGFQIRYMKHGEIDRYTCETGVAERRVELGYDVVVLTNYN